MTATPRRCMLLLLALGCGDNASTPDAGADALTPPSTSYMTVAATQSWPGGGSAITLRVHDGAGWPTTIADLSKTQMRWLADDGAANFQVAAVRVPAGHTAVVVIPSADAASRQTVRAAAAGFINGRPEGERIAVYRWGETVDLLRDFSNDRPRLVSALDVPGVLDAPATYMSAASVLTTVGDETLRVGGQWHSGLRSIVFIAAQLPSAIPSTSHAALVQWVVAGVGESERDEVGAGFVARAEDAGGDLHQAARTASDRLNSFAAAGHFRLAVCGDPAGALANLTVAGLSDLVVGLPESLEEERLSSCDVSQILAAQRTYPDTIEFQFSASERAVYDQRISSLSKADFNVSIVLGPDREPLASVAHLRGKGSITCERKSYTLNLGGKRPRYLMPRSATDEFYLISMCLDDRYVRQYTMMQLWQRLGLFPMEFRFIELKVDGVSEGVYILVEKVAEEFRQDRGRVRTVLRRGFVPSQPSGETIVEVKYSSTTDADAIGAYEAALAGLQGLNGSALIDALEKRVELADYLVLLAGASVVENGDYVDELWLAATETVLSDGTIGATYQFSGWDFEDVFGACHYSGQFAVIDPWQLTYCAEAEWDHIMLADASVYARYVDTLDGLLDRGLSNEEFQAAIDKTETELARYLRIPGVAPAMTRLVLANPAATEPDVAIQEISMALTGLYISHAARVALLRERIAAYRVQ